MSNPNPKNFEDPADEFPVSLPPPPHGRTRNGKLTETYHLWLNNLEPPLQESLGKLIWKLHEYRDDLSVSQKAALIDLLTEPCDGMLDRLSQRTRTATLVFVEEECKATVQRMVEERLKEDERREDHHGA
jgi:hypothetical protein